MFSYAALTMSSTTFFALPKTIIVVHVSPGPASQRNADQHGTTSGDAHSRRIMILANR
jgi:hypothetical protein